MPAILAPANPPEEQFTLGNELEPRRANLLGAFDDADDADGQDYPAPETADGAAACKGCAHIWAVKWVAAEAAVGVK